MAFELLLQRYQRPLFGFIRRQVGDRAEAEDLFQQTLLRIFNGINSCRDPSAFRAWAFGIAANLCRYEGRRQLALRDERRLAGGVLTLRAMLFAATGQEGEHELAVRVNGAEGGKLKLSASAEAPALVDLVGTVKPGLNVVELTGASEAQFQVVALYTQPWREQGAEGEEPLSLKEEYGRTRRPSWVGSSRSSCG